MELTRTGTIGKLCYGRNNGDSHDFSPWSMAGIEANGGTGGAQLLNVRNSISQSSALYKASASSIKSASALISKGDYDGALKQLKKASASLNKL